MCHVFTTHTHTITIIVIIRIIMQNSIESLLEALLLYIDITLL